MKRFKSLEDKLLSKNGYLEDANKIKLHVTFQIKLNCIFLSNFQFQYQYTGHPPSYDSPMTSAERTGSLVDLHSQDQPTQSPVANL